MNGEFGNRTSDFMFNSQILLFLAGSITFLNMSECQSTALRQAPDFQGHRGCRGLLPENSIPAMRKALELGVTTLEMDAVITRDRKVVLSHEPFLSHEICLDSLGKPIAKSEERKFNIYKMDFAELVHCDCGSKGHPRFPDQELMIVNKPLLEEVIREAESYARILKRGLPRYNIETKRQPDGDDLFHPDAEETARLMLEVIHAAGVEGRTTIQSFYPSTLHAIRTIDPGIEISLLEGENIDFKKVLATLNFKPDVYSCDYKLVTPELVRHCRANGIKVLPWTVNEVSDMQRLLDLGVDGLISDYPNRFDELNY